MVSSNELIEKRKCLHRQSTLHLEKKKTQTDITNSRKGEIYISKSKTNNKS